MGCGATIFVAFGSEAGGIGKESKAVDGVFGEMDRSDPEGELVKSVVASSSSSESLHLEVSSSSSSSSSSSRWWLDGGEGVYATRGLGLKNADKKGRSSVRRSASVTRSWKSRTSRNSRSILLMSLGPNTLVASAH